MIFHEMLHFFQTRLLNKAISVGLVKKAE